VAKTRSSLRPREQAEYLIEHLLSIDAPWLAWIHLWGFSAPDEPFHHVSGFDYDRRVAEMDSAIGFLFDRFRSEAEIFIYADHGYAFFEHDRWSYGKNGHNIVQPVIDVPLLVYDGTHQGRNPNLVSQTRIRELVLDSHQSLTMQDEKAFCETRYLEQPDKALAIRKGPYKLVYYYDTGEYEFYDLASDFSESINYANGNFYKVSRDKFGDHPALKPYIVRADLDKLECVKAELIEIARGYYGTATTSLSGRYRTMLKRRLRRVINALSHLSLFFAPYQENRETRTDEKARDDRPQGATTRQAE